MFKLNSQRVCQFNGLLKGIIKRRFTDRVNYSVIIHIHRHDIDAQRRAIRMQNESESTATSRREGADQYAREVMFGMEEQLSEILGQIRRGIDTLRDQPENTSSPDIQIPVS